MYQRGGSRLRLKRALAAIGHKSDARAASRQSDVLQIGGDARPTVDGNGSGVLVATGWVPDNFDAEIRLRYWRPRKRHTEQAAFEQQRVRLFFVLSEVRAVRAIDGGEDRVFAIGVRPAAADENERKAHGVAGLVTRDTRSSV